MAWADHGIFDGVSALSFGDLLVGVHVAWVEWLGSCKLDSRPIIPCFGLPYLSPSVPEPFE